MKKLCVIILVYFSFSAASQFSIGVGSLYRLDIFQYRNFDMEDLNFRKDNNFMQYAVFGSYLAKSKWKFYLTLGLIPKKYDIDTYDYNESSHGGSGYFYITESTIKRHANVRYGFGTISLRTTRIIAEKAKNYLSLGLEASTLVPLYESESEHKKQYKVVSKTISSSGPNAGTHINYINEGENYNTFNAITVPKSQFSATVPLIYGYNFGKIGLEIIQEMGCLLNLYPESENYSGLKNQASYKWLITWSVGLNLSYKFERKQKNPAVIELVEMRDFNLF